MSTDAAPALKVLIVDDEELARLRLRGLVNDNPEPRAEVVEAVRAVHAGRRYLSHKIAATAIDDYIAERHRTSPLDSLSLRERQILQLIVEGKTSAEVGTMLFLSPKTIDTYRSRMMHKLGIGDLPNLVKFAIQHGITQLD